jgi:pimeloyl-ACP methyl ester carboxylesterase
MVFGFVGGFVRSDDDRHLEVQMIKRLATERPGVRAMVFENRHRARAREEILHRLDRDGDGRLSDEEKRSAQIILVGHSWGGSAAIRLAEELNASGIPVLLTIQLDSVNRVTGDDCLIPANVAQALNFYQTRGLVHGCRAVRPMDASRTKILGNREFEYTAQPAGCSSYSWFNRHVLMTHNAMDCDPLVWSEVETEIRTHVADVLRLQREGGGQSGVSALRSSLEIKGH